MDFVIQQTVVDDIRTFHGNPVLTAHLATARETIQKGGKVFFVRDYVNASREITRTLSTMEEVDVWESEMKQATKQVLNK